MLMVMDTMVAMMVMIVCFYIASVSMFVRVDMVVLMAMSVLGTMVMLVGMLVLMFV